MSNNPFQPSQPFENIPRSSWITLVIVSFVGLIPMYGETVIIPAIPDFIRDFNISYNTSTWILTGYLIAGAVMTPISGRLSDIYGKKKMLLVILGIYIAGLTLGGFANSISVLIMARILQGIGISMFPIAFGIMKSQFPPSKLSIAQGIYTGMFTAGSAIGLALGGTIVFHYGWHLALLSIIPVPIILFFVIRRYIHLKEEEEQGKDQEQNERTNVPLRSELSTEYCCVFTKISSEQGVLIEKVAAAAPYMPANNSTKLSHAIDIKGAIALSSTIISFLLALSYLETISAESLLPIIFFSAIAIISLVCFVAIEKRRKVSPLVNPKLMTHKIILPANITLMIVGISMFIIYQTIPVLIRSPQPLGFGGDAIATANVQIPFTLIILIVSVSAGFVIPKFGNAQLGLIGSMISSAGFFSLFMLHSSELLISANLAIISVGITLTRVGIWNVTLEYAPREYTGISLGMTALLFFVGMSIGPAIAGVYMQSHQVLIRDSNMGSISSTSSYYPSSESYNLIFLTAFSISIASVAIVAVLKRRLSGVELLQNR